MRNRLSVNSLSRCTNLPVLLVQDKPIIVELQVIATTLVLDLVSD